MQLFHNLAVPPVVVLCLRLIYMNNNIHKKPPAANQQKMNVRLSRELGGAPVTILFNFPRRGPSCREELNGTHQTSLCVEALFPQSRDELARRGYVADRIDAPACV